jgi:hypothetical protein
MKSALRRIGNHSIALLLFCICNTKLFGQNKAQTLHNLNTLLINTVMDDLYTPPISARIYVYPNIAFYECIRNDDASLPSLSGKLNGLNNIPALPKDIRIDNFIAACISFSYVGQNLVGSEYKIEDWRKAFVDSLLQRGDNTVSKNSIAFGKQVADSIIAWTKKDNYLKSRGMMRHVIRKNPGSWQPTPNDYAQALEPNWNTIRPLTLKNPAQFSPAKKLLYNPTRKSAFFNDNVMEVYHISKTMDSTKRNIAKYWDDNPNISVADGHLTYFIHKISPAGHWLMITRQACIEKNVSVSKASQAYALTGIAMFDAFIACWDEKFKIDLIRPVTVINRFVDAKWEPLIQTPPFPEFTSGHAVISNAAATVLTRLLGDNYFFTDNTEIPFGIKPRSFKSFYAAAEESTWSRVYGGIHYPETARISIQQGKQVGSFVLSVYEKNITK